MKIDIKTNYEKNANYDFAEAVKWVNEKIAPKIQEREYSVFENPEIEIKRNGNLFFANFHGLRMSFGVKSR